MVYCLRVLILLKRYKQNHLWTKQYSCNDFSEQKWTKLVIPMLETVYSAIQIHKKQNIDNVARLGKCLIRHEKARWGGGMVVLLQERVRVECLSTTFWISFQNGGNILPLPPHVYKVNTCMYHITVSTLWDLLASKCLVSFFKMNWQKWFQLLPLLSSGLNERGAFKPNRQFHSLNQQYLSIVSVDVKVGGVTIGAKLHLYIILLY